MNGIPEQLKDFYNSLEQLQSIGIWNIQKELKYAESVEGEWREKVLTERKVFNYNINKGELVTNFQITNIEGKVVAINFSDKELDYLKERLGMTSNTWLKSRYAQLIWQETKHNDFAELAIENYVLTINSIKANEARELAILLSAILFISKNSKKRTEQSKDVALTLINEFPLWIKSLILDAILDNNIFIKKELKIIASNFLLWINKGEQLNYFSTKNYLDQGLRLYKTLGLPLKKIYLLYAENEDLLIKERENDFVLYEAYSRKGTFLRLAGKNEESEKIFGLCNELKQKVKLNKITTQLTEEQNDLFNKYLNKRSEAILSNSPELVFAFFSVNEGVLVDPVENRENAIKNFKNSLYSLFSTSIFDINSNYKNLNDDEKIEAEVIKNYTISHAVIFSSLFIKVFVEGVISGKINYYLIYDYLEKHTWYGTKFIHKMGENKIDNESTWISMIAPGIHNLISQFEMSVMMNTNKVNNFILAIDSLTMKFEGALRDFIRLCKGNTTKYKNDRIEEQLLEELLRNPKIIELFSKRDIELFNYTFTKKGQNIRNNVAHSFFHYSNYSLETATLVFLCFLRLGKYSFK